ncbi:Xaa-Pro aminopeptidase 1 [Actinorhabdospora filicis]|uniref:Xaa-Pro aminopeptidase n=1 Tax=Actinorhabdospora filicis TaxID=1785913 RepID=A0A9W6WA81_9ACTN|nr:aminopeptidase P family protein [Actinorhabdospora filicis]GLZ78758.1 Xaa-Pro aminopeptidase 1 [Actinorhabdospora filicis]
MSEDNTVPTQPVEGERKHDTGYPPRLLEFMRTGWGESPIPGLTRLPQAANHAQRRARLSELFPGQTLVIPTGGEKQRANDTFFRFRAGSDFAWLTGDYDPEGVLVLHATAGGHDAVLYRRARKSRSTDEFFRSAQYGELWIGRSHSLEEKSLELGVETRNVTGLVSVLEHLAPAATRVLRGFDADVDAKVAVTGSGERDVELAERLSELRALKDAWEIAQLQEAVDITVRGFEDVARVLPATGAVSERLIEGVFALRARHEGNGVGYDSIVGAGSHATTLHWIRNDGATTPGELLLMDMGVENNHLYTADVTRTVPVSGSFTPLQRQVYDLVYASQQAGIDAIKPGVVYKDITQVCMRVLAEGLHDLGLLTGSVEATMEPDSQLYRRWTLHGYGHFLGLDVHDCANARREHYHDGEFQPGHVVTVEPGLYFQADDELVPAELRGVGVRIEDDILVTADGTVNLSDGLPRTSAQVETWLGEQRAAGPRLPG